MKGRFGPLMGSFLFLVVAPGTVAGWAPWLITRWELHPPFLGRVESRVLGAALALAGLVALLESFGRFALEGRGTPAPPVPTERHVISGLYAYVRNPMYVAVLLLIFGQAMFLASTPLLVYGVAIGCCFHAFVLLYEEPTLRPRYGQEYEDYCREVRRWRPRSTAWRGSGGTDRRGPPG